VGDSDRAIGKWIKQLSEKDMPVFSGTVSEVTEVVNSEDTSASDVAQVVLRDASLTGRLLKAVNSFHFNPTNQAINTVSRAVMVMGFDQVRALTLSMILVDNLSQGAQRQKLVDEMALAFHAATQAQEFAKLSKAGEPEDIFVATLLSRLGKMAFWAFADDKAEELMREIDAGGNENTAEAEVLGFQLAELTKALSQEWHLGDVVNDYLHGRMDKKKAACIDAGLVLADMSKAGWDNDAADDVIQKVASTLDLKADKVKERAHANAKTARDVTKIYGSYAASQCIPLPNQPLIDEEDVEPEVLPTDMSDVNLQDELTEVETYPEPDIDYQMTVMQEISATIQERPSIGIILEMVLEGIHRGVGMDRAVFAMFNPERTHLSCKYVIGDNAEAIQQQLKIDVRRPENVFNQIIKNQHARWIPGDPKQLGGTLSRETMQLLGTPPYFVMPAIVRNKVIGLFLADRNASSRMIQQQDFLAFQQFCQQANMGLTILAMQG
jgi:HD-like signal output (HDOD) protein